MKNVRLSGVALSIVAALASGAASAGTNSTMAVSAAIAAECAVTQNLPIAFGNLTMLNGALQSTADSVRTGSFNAICTNGTGNPQFKYTSANGSGGAFRLVGADTTTFITYTVHQDGTAAASAVGYDTAESYSGFTADGTSQTLSVSAKILAASKNGKKVQTYTDTITVTATFDA